jgi:hypothetical protein
MFRTVTTLPTDIACESGVARSLTAMRRAKRNPAVMLAKNLSGQGHLLQVV